MPFDPKTQQKQARELADHFERQLYRKRLPSLTSSQVEYLYSLAEYVYSCGYDRGWRESRTNP